LKFVFEYGGGRMWWSVLSPVYDEMIKRGLPAEKGGSLGNALTEEKFHIWCRGSTIPERSIYVPHGISWSELNRTVEVGKLDKPLGILLPGPRWLNRFNKEFSGTAGHEAVQFKMVGWPKSDILFSENVESIKEEMRKIFNLEGRKTILLAGSGVHAPLKYWMMQREPMHYKVWKSLFELTKRRDVNVLIKPHNGKEGSVFEIPNEMKGDKMIWADPTVHGNIMPFFLVADVLVTNSFSSCCVEFLPLDKPLIFYDGGPQSFADQIGPVCTPETAGKEVEKALDGVDAFKNKRSEWLQKLIYKPDGHASERAVDAILEMVG